MKPLNNNFYTTLSPSRASALALDETRRRTLAASYL